MDNTFLASVEKGGEIPTSEHEEGKETPSAPPAETKPKEGETAPPAGEKPEGETGEPKEGEPKVFQAFHKHPRWLSLQKELHELREFREKVSPLLDRIGEKPESGEETKEIPAWFSDLFGDNADAWRKYQAYSASERKALREEIMAELREESQKVQDEAKKWDQWVEDQFTELSEDGETAERARAIGFDLANKDQLRAFRNELFKIALDYQPSDDENNVSLAKAFDILELQKQRKAPDKKPADLKKEIADKTMAKGKPEGGKRDYKTPADLMGKSMRDLVPDE